MKYLIVVDMQKDFIDGSLGTDEALAIVPKVIKKARDYEGEVIFTLDTHYENYFSTQEGKFLPVMHCVEGEEGWKLDVNLQQICDSREAKVYCKETFGSESLANDLREIHKVTPIDEIELCGLCTDICVVSNAMLLKAYLPEVPVIVDASCCAGVTPRTHKSALDVMKMCQIIVKK